MTQGPRDSPARASTGEVTGGREVTGGDPLLDRAVQAWHE